MAKLKADVLDVVTSKPGDPVRFTTYHKGDEVKGLTAERQEQLIAAGALEDPEASESSDGKPGESKAPGESGATDEAPEDQRTEPDGNDTPEGSTSTDGLTPEAAAELTGSELDEALKARDLSTSGKVAEKQERLVQAVTPSA